MSLHAHNEAERTQRVLAWLDAGETLALVSDAGTPLVSDPGGRLVQAVAERGHTVVPIPGPSAVLAALVGAGLPADRFTFLGFPERKGSGPGRAPGARGERRRRPWSCSSPPSAWCGSSRTWPRRADRTAR